MFSFPVSPSNEFTLIIITKSNHSLEEDQKITSKISDKFTGSIKIVNSNQITFLRYSLFNGNILKAFNNKIKNIQSFLGVLQQYCHYETKINLLFQD